MPLWLSGSEECTHLYTLAQPRKMLSLASHVGSLRASTRAFEVRSLC